MFCCGKVLTRFDPLDYALDSVDEKISYQLKYGIYIIRQRLVLMLCQ